MPMYFNINTNEFPLYPEDMRVRFGDFNLDNLPNGYVVAKDVIVPENSKNQSIEELMPVFVNGDWFRQYAVTDLTQEQIDRIAQGEKERDPQRKVIPRTDLSGSAPNVIE